MYLWSLAALTSLHYFLQFHAHIGTFSTLRHAKSVYLGSRQSINVHHIKGNGSFLIWQQNRSGWHDRYLGRWRREMARQLTQRERAECSECQPQSQSSRCLLPHYSCKLFLTVCINLLGVLEGWGLLYQSKYCRLYSDAFLCLSKISAIHCVVLFSV